MIILGYTTKGKVLQTNSFICPKCAGRRYELTEYKRYFTIFFIPLFPLVKVGEAAVCSSCKTTWTPGAVLGSTYPSQTQTTTTEDTKAPIVKRVFSWFVDTLLAAILTVAIQMTTNIGGSNEAVFYLLYSAGWLIYGISCDIALNGRTVGKMLFYIQVKKDDESELTVSAIILRNIVKSTLIFFGLPILVLTMLIREDRKSLHDLVAGTNVFEVPAVDK